MNLPQKVLELHRALGTAGIEHAFGGALALAYCIGEPRGTADIDVNVFVPGNEAQRVLDALPDGVKHTPEDAARALTDGQVRVRWDDIPIDLFFAYDDFHHQAAARIRRHPFGEHRLPFLDCTDLAVFKAYFDRPRDWVDIAMSIRAGSVDVGRVRGWLVDYLGPDDHRAERLDRVAAGSDDIADFAL